MIALLLRLLLLFCGVAMAFGLAGLAVFYLAWIFSQRDNGWRP
jgi:hypothetical protein